MNKDIDKALKDKFLCQTRFTQDIEALVKNNKDLNYIDAMQIHVSEEKMNPGSGQFEDTVLQKQSSTQQIYDPGS